MDPEELRASIPATEDTIYFNTGASSPTPQRVIESMSEVQRQHGAVAPGQEGMYPFAFELFDETRATIASLINAFPDEIALTQSTTDGINLVANAIEWDSDDTIVRTDVEHPAGILPWNRLRDVHGVNVETIHNDGGYFNVDAFKSAVDEARLVCLSSIAWNYGTRLPVRQITELAHEAGALVLLDGVQSVGQTDIDMKALGVDFCSAAGHKWLLGPWGGGFLYVNEGSNHHLNPTRIGAMSVEEPYNPEYQFATDASKLEVSTMSVASYHGLKTAIELIMETGIDTIESRIESLTSELKHGIENARLVSPETYESGLVSFHVDDPEEFVERLSAEEIILRTIPDPECVRASVHVFNSREEIATLVEYINHE